jgi:hypothetical protein
MEAAPYILQIAFFGAAGTSFVLAHLNNLAAREKSGESGNPAKRWRIWRHPHLGLRDERSVSQLRTAALMQSAWGFVFLIAGFATPAIFRFLHIGA